MIAFDPTKLLSEPADATTVARALLHGPRGDVHRGSLWKSVAATPLAAMLYAASTCGNGKGIEWVLMAVNNLQEDNASPDAPGWHSAARDAAAVPVLQDALLRTLSMDPRQRDSIVMTMRDALSPWQQPAKGN
jgi:hypothetical protein